MSTVSVIAERFKNWKDSVVIHLTEDGRNYTVDDKEYPRVSRIIDIIDKPFLRDGGTWDLQLAIKFIEENHIDIVYNCTDIYDFPDCDVTKIRLPFSSAQGEQNISLLQGNHRKISQHIHDNLEHSNIFIGCPDGKCIAPLLVAIYILHHGSLNPKSIYEMLLTKDSSLSLWCDLALFQ